MRSAPSVTSDPAKDDSHAAYFASQWQLIWWKFRKHKLAMLSVAVLGVLYVVAGFCEFLSPYGPLTRFPEFLDAPPQRIRLFEAGSGLRSPFVYGIVKNRDPETFRRIYPIDRAQVHAVRLLVRGEPYRLWGLFDADLHLFGVDDSTILLLGTDRLGRDLFTRILHGARISLSVGLVGVFLTFVIGIVLGGISGYLGGVVDTIIQRMIDLLLSIPTIPLWMALAAALPRDWPAIGIYFGIVLIFSVIGWTELARVVRGRLLSVREEDFVVAARVTGSSHLSIIFRHLIPSCSSYIIVSLTLAIPTMILGETALSFLGLGLQPPVVSWGTLLKDAQSMQAIAHRPWLLSPCLFVVVAVLMFNFMGDGLRDSADPLK